MATDLETLLVRIDATTEGLRRELKKGEAAVIQSDRNMSRSLGGLEKKFASFGRVAGAGLAAIGVSFGASALISGVKSAFDAFDALAESAQRLGLSAENLQELQFAAREMGSDAEGLASAWEKFTKAIGTATQESGPLYDILRQYNIALKDQNGLTRGSMALYRDLADAAKKSGDVIEYARIAVAMFGKEGIKLAPMLAAGSAGFDAMAAKARSLGDVINNETVRDAARLQREYETVMDSLAKKWMGLVALVAQGFAGRDTTGLAARNLARSTAARERLEQRKRDAPDGLLNFADRTPEGAAALDARIRTAISAEQRARNALRALEKPSGASVLDVPDAAPAPINGSIKPLSEFLDEIKAANRGAASGLPDNDDFSDMLGASMDDIAALERINELILDKNDALDGMASALLASLDPMEDLRQKTAELDELQSRLTPEQYAAALAKISKEALLASETMEGGFARALEGLEGNLSSIDWFAGNIFKQMGNAFKRTINDMINEAFRLAVIKPLMKSIFGGSSGGGIFGSIFKGLAGAKAGGGPVTAHSPYLVGEKGPEVFVPGASGGIVPNHKMGGGQQIIVQQTIRFDVGLESVDTRIQRAAPKIAAQAAQAVRNANQRTAGAFIR